MPPALTIDENIETLKRSALPTIVCEGTDDAVFFRRLEEDLSTKQVSLFPVNGRDMVLKIFERRREIGRNNIAFLVDNDLWLYSGIPEHYRHRKIFRTDGYSIENDLYRDGELEALLYPAERDIFAREIRVIAEWFSHCVSEHLDGKDAPLAEHPQKVLSSDGSEVCPKFAVETGFTGPCPQRFPELYGDFRRLLRGKTLMQVISRRFAVRRGRTKFGVAQLMEIGAAKRGTNYQRLFQLADSFF